MKITVSQKEILKGILPGTRPEYSLLKYFANCYNDALILDLGTRIGESALALSDNPSNTVHTYDIAVYSKHGVTRCAPGNERPNIKFFVQDCTTLDANVFKDASIVYLDVSHNGADEAIVLEKLAVHFKGILILDDISSPRRWPQLHDLWESITLPKILVPTTISAARGTGVVMYGDQVEITE